MKQYKKVYRDLGFSDEYIAIATGELQIPNGVEQQPAQVYGFPPALIPIWSNPDSMIYTGYWKHWFCNREPSFIRMYVNVGYSVKEIARSFPQFGEYLILEEITFEDDLTEKIALFANKIGVFNTDQIDQVSITSGDDPIGLLELPAFKNHAPLACFNDQTKYQGDFPHQGMALEYAKMSKICTLELSEQVEKDFINSKECPEWFLTQNKKKLFYKYLSHDKLSEAWFTLNSTGWLFADVYPALDSLAKLSNNVKFESLVDAWNSVKHDKYKTGY